MGELLVQTSCGGGVLTMEVTPYLNVYSIHFERSHSQNSVDDGIQTNKQTNKQTNTQENTAYDDKQELQHGRK